MAKKIRVWDGSAWQDVAPSLPYTAIHSAQASMPLTGVDGQVWLDTDGTLAGQNFVPSAGGTMTGNLNTPSINSGGISGQNYLLNGAMDFWQRGTSTTSGAVYLADRWICINNNTYYRSTDVPSNQGFQYSAGWGFTSSASFPLISYRIPAEEAIFFAGKTVTLSFWAKNVSGTAALYTEYLTPNATNNFPNNVTNQGLVSFHGTPSSTWTRYSGTFTATTDLVRGMEIRIVRGNQSPSETLTTGFKLELGNQMTAFTRANPDLATELAACQRYFTRYGSSAAFSPFGTGFCITNAALSFTLPYRVRMRANPTLSFSAGNTFATYSAAGAVTAGTSMVLDRTGDDAALLTLNVASGLAAGQAANAITNAGATSFIDVNAEL